MLVEQKLKTLQDLISTSTHEELIWVNGYLNGILSKHGTNGNEPAVNKPGVNKITITYATETGNSKKLATEMAAKAKRMGIKVKVQSLDQYRLSDLVKEEYFLAVISTHGDGEPPATARTFYDFVHQEGLQLPNLKYSVLALGDSSYPLFCQAGEDVDNRLNALGASRIVPLQKCDIDFEPQAKEWLSRIFNVLNESSTPIASPPFPVEKKSTGRKIYTEKLLTNINLNDTGSLKQTHHIEIEAEDVAYQPGDAIGVIPENKAETVEKIIAITGIAADKTLDYKGAPATVYELLKKKLNIVHLPERVVKKYADLLQQDIPATRMDLLDLLRIFPVKDKTEFIETLKILEPIVPRLYSISSSPEAHPGEVHVTVAKNCFTINDELNHGLASEFLSLLNEDNELEFYVHPNNSFRLPEEDKSVIMIGPGTGIAPFRSFIAERDASGAPGKNWLFFGEQHFITDFLYQAEIQSWLETGALTKVETAFSRDQPEKIYVQDKMLQQGHEFYQWLDAGSHVYVCGAREPMSRDVEQTLLLIIEKFGEKTKNEAQQYLDNLKVEGRYVTDVY